MSVIVKIINEKRGIKYSTFMIFLLNGNIGYGLTIIYLVKNYLVFQGF